MVGLAVGLKDGAVEIVMPADGAEVGNELN